MSSGLRQKRWYPPLQLSQIDQHCLSSDILDMESSGGIQVDVMMVGSKFGRWQGAQCLE